MKKILTLFFALGCLCSLPSWADVKLPRLISDGMILQRDKPIHIWGWADEGEAVSVTLGKQTLKTVTKAGHWQLTFKPLKACTQTQIDIQGKNHIAIKNVLLGDIWVAAGQSNMELPIRRVLTRYPDLIQTTNLPDIREFSVPIVYSFKGPEQDYPSGEWKMATPENLPGFSAAGFFFARDLYQTHHVPIGLLTLPVGGSPLEAWVSEDALRNYPHYLSQTQQFKDDNFLQNTIQQDKAKVDAWYAKAKADDLGTKGQWQQEKLSMGDWQTLTVPGLFKDQKIDFTNGILWLRKTVSLTAAQAQQPATLWLGAIVDGDEVYINGQLVGQTGYQYPPRIYKINPGVLKAGENVISIRLTSYSSNPGFVKEKAYALELGSEKISLAGDWKYKVAMRGDSFPKTTTIHYLPAGLFNGKVSPALPMGIKGVIWYQGESNTDRAAEYEKLFPELVADWRKQFNQGDFPFVFAQLANFMSPPTQPAESNWAALRESQRKSLAVKNTAMAVLIDVGEWNDIHPLNKQAVGERLALGARKLAYGEKNLVASGPLATNVSATKNGLLVHFSKGTGDLVIKGDLLKQIAVAGADNKYYWAQAKIQGKDLLVWSDQVTEPKSVRYAWADNPEGANLYNSAGLPASPFQVSLKP